MVQRQMFHQRRKGEAHVSDDEEAHGRKKPKLFYLLLLLLLLSLLSCSFVVVPQLFGSSSLSLYNFGIDSEGAHENYNANAPPYSSMSSGTICCDRSGFRSDVCIMKGDVRTHSPSSSVFLYLLKQPSGFDGFISSIRRAAEGHHDEELQHEKMRPYKRKWENIIMDKIDQLDLNKKKDTIGAHHHCDVRHGVPVLLFSTGGCTGNIYHEFNDGILPLYITSQHFKKEVVLVILEYRSWWITNYGDILSHLMNYQPIDFCGDKRSHCFPEAIVGLKIHNELTVDPLLMNGKKSILDFRHLLDRAYWPRINGLIQDEEREMQLKLNQALSSGPVREQLMKINKEDQKPRLKKPNLVILSRSGSTALVNEDRLIKMAEEMGFKVEVLRPDRTTELAKIYRVLNSSEVMIGVHGAAMTHFLFLKPGSVLIQVVPLGTDWAAETYYGEPARKLGLKYIGYEILPRESSLYSEYDKADPVLTDPKSVTDKGWEYTKKIYLDSQNVSLDMRRFGERLLEAYNYSIKINWHANLPLKFQSVVSLD